MDLKSERGTGAATAVESPRTPAAARLQVRITGAVQGVGFRPFVFRLAHVLMLRGWVRNDACGVALELEGSETALRELLLRLGKEAPLGSRIETCEAVWLDPVGYERFIIRPSDSRHRAAAWIRPDSATCPECRREILDAANRRYRYPFTNCTHCGPRYTIVTRLPYDRANTSMAGFRMCPECQSEYLDPADRRFHAQPNACPRCGPQLELWDPTGRALLRADPALVGTVDAIRQGRIVAIKGLGGFQLVVRAGDEDAVARLRERKQRDEKPFALMYPALAGVRRDCEVGDLEERALESPEAPIVLLRRRPRPESGLAPNVAPGQPNLGVMLPYTPLHHLLLHDLGQPIVATSGNRRDEPICIDEQEALERLAGIADLLLVHDRPILRHVDDSIVHIVAGREMVLRRARGFAPLPVPLPPDSRPGELVVLGVGAHLKNCIALGIGPNLFISQHLGDLETVEAHAAFRRSIQDLEALYEVRPGVVACDTHPDYLSTRYAHSLAAGGEEVQHHHAHIAAVLAENELDGPLLGVAWDGTGLGDDGTIWGGEFLRVDGAHYDRVAHLRPFPLPGGDAAAREPRRAALGLLLKAMPALFERSLRIPPLAAFTEREIALLTAMIRSRLNTPLTSSVGRLFDAVASILGICQRSHYEGQAAMAVEAAIDGSPAGDAPYALPVRPGPTSSSPLSLDWQPLVEGIVGDVDAGLAPGRIARRFHDALIEAIVEVARRVGEAAVGLGGGCFQNRYLLENARRRLLEEGFRVYWPQRVPPNDGGIALGQVAVARWRRRSPDAGLAPFTSNPLHERNLIPCV